MSTTAEHKPIQSASLLQGPNLKWVLLLSVLIITFFCFSYSLQNQFTGWDDDTYVTYDKYITSLSGSNLNALLFKNVTDNYYHPLTMLSLAVNYHFSQLNPAGYYLTNILIHLFNVCMVFCLVLAILNAMANKGYEALAHKYWIAATCSLWFGIHPMHVESVSWISERKDLLYAFFYFIGMICHINYIGTKAKKWIVLVTVCYVLSCLSKPMGVVFPVSLLAIDFLLKRKFELKLFTEKLPLFVLSVFLGVMAFITSGKAGSVASLGILTFSQRIMFPAYGFMMYSLKAVAPFFLSSFYPYPDITAPTLPFIFYIAPLISLGLVAVPIYIAYKKGNNLFRIIVFGLGFYLANLVFVLQFVSVGRTIMSDRYSYVAYFGLLFTLVYLLFYVMQKMPDYKTGIQVSLICFSVLLALLCKARTYVWHNSETLWRNVAQNYPLKVGEAYESLGNYYYLQGNVDSAYSNFNTLSLLYYKDPYVFNKVGNLCLARQDYNGALAAFTKSLQIDTNYYDSYVDRGGLYTKQSKFYLALSDYTHASRMQPNNVKVLLNKGASELNTGRINDAIADFTKVNALSPNNGTSLYALSLAYKKAEDYENALKYAIQAKTMGINVPDDYINKLKTEQQEK